MKTRCNWVDQTELMQKYHDEEWGVPLHDDDKLFEFMVLDAFQAGLSWSTILKKREGFRRAFDGFNAVKIANYDNAKVEELMQDESIIRNRQKIVATIKNAKAFLRIQKEHGSFDKYIWQFTGHQTIKNHYSDSKELPATSPESIAMSKALKKEGFAFVGPTICYAFMQAAGMINDHLTTCFRYKE
ncbi:DNA-3-methyladenine glycosylase I [Carboxylicivirga caseinilyticus]|uniref:DNA-3-methyladenine glycosylase I n=1 Tax=Carboxylicivirga caseinilyticus TaxID=3417572 RepID=UPI003D336E83|nr:DNA-3-methyladenine glycosylase I [Marinilabiliaceae bacterium A049]